LLVCGQRLTIVIIVDVAISSARKRKAMEEDELPVYEMGYIAGALFSFSGNQSTPEEEADLLGLSGEDRMLFLVCYVLAKYQAEELEE
jgi:hypothetical protein